jgi:hypothetical protein
MGYHLVFRPSKQGFKLKKYFFHDAKKCWSITRTKI